MLNRSRLVRQLATMLTASALSLGAASCGAPQTPTQTQPLVQQAPPAPPIEDVVLSDFEKVEVSGMRFSPEGFGYPGMVKVTPPKKTTLDKLRKALPKAKPATKADDVKVLVSMLWDEAQSKTKDAGRPLLEEARAALLDLQTNHADKVDELVLTMLFTAELWLDNDQGALKAADELMTKFAGSKSAQALAPWVAFMYLKYDRTADAANLVSGWTLDAADMDYLRAYDLAWVAFRMRDYDKAREAIVWAAKNWKSKGTRPAVERDLVLFLARGGTPVDQAAAILAELSGGNLEMQYVWLYRLCEGYELAGYPALAGQALAKALEVLGDKVPPNDRVAIEQRRSTDYLIAHMPAQSADAGIAAYQALVACGQACSASEQAIAELLTKMALHFHSTYTITQDETYYGAAKKLYEYYLTLKRQDGETIRSYLTRLEETKDRAPANGGKHDKELIGKSTTLYNQAVTACYEEVLQGEPGVTGELKLTLELDHTGKVQGVDSEPKAGAEGLAAVASCLDRRARAWIFPARSKQGKSVVMRSYSFAPKAEAPAAPAAPAAQ